MTVTNTVLDGEPKIGTTTSPSDAVFNVPELLEMILLNLPIREILLNADRVCSGWNAIIRDSPKLQQALFFAPIQGQTIQFIQETFDPTRKEGIYAADSSDSSHLKITANPFYRALTDRSRLRRGEVYERKHASWRHMLLCQPPIKAAHMSSPFSRTLLKVSNPTGVTLQDIKHVQVKMFERLFPRSIYGRSGFFYLPEVVGSAQWTCMELDSEEEGLS